MKFLHQSFEAKKKRDHRGGDRCGHERKIHERDRIEAYRMGKDQYLLRWSL